MRSWKTAFTGEYLAGPDLADGDLTLTIDRAQVQEVEDTDGKGVRQKLVIHWRERHDKAKPFIPSKTAAICIDYLCGEDMDQWPGRCVTLYFDPAVKFGFEQVGGIRVRGSPDMVKPVTIQVKLPRKKAQPVKLIPTGQPQKPAPAPVEPVDLDALDQVALDQFVQDKGMGRLQDLDFAKLQSLARRLAKPDMAEVLDSMRRAAEPIPAE